MEELITSLDTPYHIGLLSITSISGSKVFATLIESSGFGYWL